MQLLAQAADRFLVRLEPALKLGDLPAQSDLLHEEWFIAEDPTWAGMSVQLEAQEIDPQYGWAELWDSSIWIDVANTMDVRLGLPHFVP